MEKTTKKFRTERDTAIQERDELKQQLSAVFSELVVYKKAEEKTEIFHP